MNNSQYAFLTPKNLKFKTPFVRMRPEWTHALLEDPAFAVMTDFTIQSPYTTNEDVNLQFALEQMKLAKVRSLFVVDADGMIIGHVSARDIQGTKPAKIANHYDIKPNEVTVKMLMIACSDMVALNLNDLSNARVGHIVRLFHDLGVNYIFVFENDDAGQEVLRGMFSISRVTQQLGENVMGDLSSHSVAEMNKHI